MSTKEKLARAMRTYNAPDKLIADALAGKFDDFESESATPIINLVGECRLLGLNELAERAINGEFDATEEEAKAWHEREGKFLI